MAFTSSAVWEVWSNGDDSFGGGFDPGVAGFPTDGTTDANTGNTASPVFSSASYNFVAGDVGAWVYIKSGTNSIPGWYKIASVASNKATLNATAGAGVLAAGTPTTATGIATVGTPTSLTWGIDYSQSSSARITYTDMVIGGTTTQFTSAGNPVGKNIIGNIINVTSGTGFTVQRVVVVSTAGTTATCDKSLGAAASTGGNGKLGGAFASPALPFSVAVASNSIWCKTGSYTISSASTNVAGGCINITVGSLRFEGYATVRGDKGTRPTFTASGISTFSIIGATNSDAYIDNFILDCGSLTSSQGIVVRRHIVVRVWCKNATNNGFANNTPGILRYCEASGCSSQPAFASSGVHDQCAAHDNTATGFSGGIYTNCLSWNNSGASSDGFSITGSASHGYNCIAYNNGRDGFRVSSNTLFINSIAEANAGSGFNITTSLQPAFSACAVYNNGTNISTSGPRDGITTLTASAFVAPSNGNFALNAAAGGGALLRAAGIPGVTPDGLSTGYIDVGAIQAKPLMTLGFGWTGGIAN